MRTKTMLLTAAMVAAGALSSVAQNVYSVNVVGYVNVPVFANRTYVLCNPLDGGSNGNNITNILTNVGGDNQAGANVYTFSGHFNDPETYLGTGVGWLPGTNILSPGKGFFFQPVVDGTVTFVGTVQTSNTVVLNPGLSLVGSTFPISTNLSALGLHGTAAGGDNIYRFFSAQGLHGAYGGGITSIGTDFWIDNDSAAGPAGPNLNVAEAVFYINANSAYTWTQNFTIQ